MMRSRWSRLLVAMGVAAIMLVLSGASIGRVIILLGLILVILMFGTRPLALIIARIGFSIRWKFEVAVTIVALLFLFVSLISFGAMDFMHQNLHDIQDLGPDQSLAVLRAVSELEDTQHGPLFSMIPFLGTVGLFVAAAIGAAMAWAVTEPVRGMEEAMRRMGSGDFSQRVQVENNDELGALASRINDAATGLARLQEASTAELRVARDIQQTLLPSNVPELPGWQVGAYYQPAREVGGDFYDFLDLPGGRMGFVVGDSTDKGIPASLVMATTRAMLRSAAEQTGSPGEVRRRVNDMLYADIPPKMFVTCMYAILDPATGVLEYANAGHHVPYRRGDNGIGELRATGMPLGLMPDMTYDEQQTALSPGESILFYSDGLVEAHNTQREMFGFPRLRSLVGDHPGGKDIIDFLLAELTAFTGTDWEQEDDVTMVSLQRTSNSHTPGQAPEEDREAQESETRSRRTLVEFSVSSQLGNERLAMQRVAEAIQALDLPLARTEKLKTAVAEATMNAMEHGNEYRPELPVNIRVSASSKILSVHVTDQGGGLLGPDPELPDLEAKLAGLQRPRGWGLYLIKNMVDDMQVTSQGAQRTVELIMHLEGEQDGTGTL